MIEAALNDGRPLSELSGGVTVAEGSYRIDLGFCGCWTTGTRVTLTHRLLLAGLWAAGWTASKAATGWFLRPLEGNVDLVGDLHQWL